MLHALVCQCPSINAVFLFQFLVFTFDSRLHDPHIYVHFCEPEELKSRIYDALTLLKESYELQPNAKNDRVWSLLSSWKHRIAEEIENIEHRLAGLPLILVVFLVNLYSYGRACSAEEIDTYIRNEIVDKLDLNEDSYAKAVLVERFTDINSKYAHINHESVEEMLEGKREICPPAIS